MRRDDARKLDHETLEPLRIRSVRSVQAAESPAVITPALRIASRTIYGWLALYRRGGGNSLKAKPVFIRASTEAGRVGLTMDLRYGDAKQPVAPEIPVRPLAAITSRGHMRFMIKDGGVDAAVFIEFLQRLVAGAKHTIFVDRGPVHRAKKTAAFVETLGGKLRLFFLPPYSPDRNPDELVWKYLKANTVGRVAVPGKDDFPRKVRSSMCQLQKDPEKSAPCIRIRPECFDDFSTLYGKNDVIPAKACGHMTLMHTTMRTIA